MALRKRGKMWHYRFEARGIEYSGSTELPATGRNRSVARKAEAAARKEILMGHAKSRTRLSFIEAAAHFLRWAEGEHRAKPSTYRRVKTSFASIIKFFSGKLLSAIDAGAVEDYKTMRRAENRVQECTLHNDLYNLSKFFRYAISRRWTAENPARQVKIPSGEDAVRVHVLTSAEERAYFAAAKPGSSLHDLARLMLTQGCRPEELMSLRKDDVDLERGVLHIRGGKSRAARRTLTLVQESRAVLGSRMAGESPWVFPSARKAGCHVVSLQTVHDQACRDAGVSFVLYDLRHTMATRLATHPRIPCPLPTLAAILGHSSLRAVQKYVHPTAEDQKRAMLAYEEAARPAERKEAVQ